MQVLCIAAEAGSTADVLCPCCAQGFVLFYSRFGRAEQAQARERIVAALREQHAQPGPPHRLKAFNLPLWSGPPHTSATAVLNGLSVRQRVKE